MAIDSALPDRGARTPEVLRSDLAQQVTSLCATLPPGELLDHVAHLLATALPLREVAIYLTSASNALVRLFYTSRGSRVRGASPPRTAESAQARRLGAAARLALRHQETYLHIQRAFDRSNRARGAVSCFTLALPLDTTATQTVLVVSGATEHAELVRDVLAGAQTALAAAARMANLERKVEQACVQNEQLQTIVAQSAEALIMIDGAYRIVAANDSSAKLLEWGSDRYEGTHCSQVLACRDERGSCLCYTKDCPVSQAFAQGDASTESSAVVQRQVSWQTTRGKVLEVSAIVTPLVTAEGRRAAFIAHDMTPVNDVDRMRAHFISMVSHELRTPTNSINGFLEIVLGGHVGPLTPRQEEFLNYARTSTQQLITLVEDTLFISRADTGQFKLRRDSVDVADLIGTTLQNCRPDAEHANVHLRAELPATIPSIYADELRVQQVLTNLIHNAIKFTPPEGNVTVRVEVWPNDLCFDVCDTGEGVPLDEQVRIFERFYQSPNTVQGKAGGYGLGLAIAQLIVKQHGGRIWVASAPPDGSTFSFTIPLARQPAPDSATHTAEWEAEQHRREPGEFPAADSRTTPT